MMLSHDRSLTGDISYFEINGLRLAQSEHLMKVGTDSRLLTAWVSRQNYHKVLDVGCGIGFIGILLASLNRESSVTAMDIDPQAVDAAWHNAQVNGLDNVRVLYRDVEALVVGECYDLIVSNPPYFVGQLPSQDVQRRKFRHNDGGFVDGFAEVCEKYLTPDGMVCIVIPAGMESYWSFRLAQKGLVLDRKVTVRYNDSSSPSCILVSYSRGVKGLLNEEMFMQDSNGLPDEGYLEFMNGL